MPSVFEGQAGCCATAQAPVSSGLPRGKATQANTGITFFLTQTPFFFFMHLWLCVCKGVSPQRTDQALWRGARSGLCPDPSRPGHTLPRASSIHLFTDLFRGEGLPLAAAGPPATSPAAAGRPPAAISSGSAAQRPPRARPPRPAPARAPPQAPAVAAATGPAASAPDHPPRPPHPPPPSLSPSPAGR